MAAKSTKKSAAKAGTFPGRKDAPAPSGAKDRILRSHSDEGVQDLRDNSSPNRSLPGVTPR